MPGATPTVSVVMPCHNAMPFIQDAIASVVSQTVKSLELLAVDDASSDGTAESLAAAAARDPRIRVLAHEVRRGAAAARNMAMKQARGTWLAFLDADDIWHPQKLELQLQHMQKLGSSFAYTDYRGVLPNGRLCGRARIPAKTTRKKLPFNTAIGTSTVLVSRALVGNKKMPNVPRRHDLAFWMHILAEEATAIGLPRVLTFYRVGHQSLSGNPFAAVRGTFRVLRSDARLSLAFIIVAMPSYILHAYRRKKRLSKPSRNDRLKDVEGLTWDHSEILIQEQ